MPWPAGGVGNNIGLLYLWHFNLNKTITTTFKKAQVTFIVYRILSMITFKFLR